jgi:NADH-quinone oxidoreductase subunit F
MEHPLTKHIQPGGKPLSIADYEKQGGYGAFRKAVGSMTPLEVQEEVSKSGLRGRGGAGFPTGKKWSVVPRGADVRRPVYLVVNADEMEPGAFKDRLLLEANPHLLIEGALLAAYAIQADMVFLFVRWAYEKARQSLRAAAAEARARGYIGKNILKSPWSAELRQHSSAGRYMCGEETGLLNALEGKRANPRSKPPFPQMCGLYGKPTVVNNVETLCCVPGIIEHGAAWFASLSRSEESGTKLYGVSGRVNVPGVWELPMGTTVRELIEDHAGGMKPGYRLRGFLPGGASTDFLTDQHLDVPLDFGSLQKAGSRLGTGTIVVLDNLTCPVGMVHNLETFFARESCGWCTPCRDGIPWTRYLLADIEEGRGRSGDIERLSDLCALLAPGKTFCAFAPGAMEPLQSALKYFREDFEKHIARKECPYRKENSKSETRNPKQ